MAQAAHGIQDFISQVRKTDFARSNRFEIQFTYPQIMQSHYTSQGETPKLISMMAEDIIFPGLLLGTRAYRINNLNEQRATSIDFGGDSITFNFFIDASWSVKDFFGDWMRKIVDPVTRELAYPNEYYAEIHLYALNNMDEVVAHWQIDDAFPRSIAPVTASVTNAQVMRLPVTFAYKKWRVIGGYDPEGNPLRYNEDPQFDTEDGNDFTADTLEQDVDRTIADIEAETADDTIT